MSPLPDRKTLESMRRADLQRLCKERGLKANMKTEALIDLLVETHKPAGSTATYKRSSSMRIVSRSHPSSGVRNRVGSMVIHDTDDEEEPEGAQTGTEPTLNNASSSRSQIPKPATRNRRPADDQRRLGLGRPRALGGIGLRVPPRVASRSSPRKVKVNRSARPVETPIQEEEEDTTPRAGPSGTSHDPPAATQATQSTSLTDLSTQAIASSNSQILPTSDDMIAALQAQLRDTQAEVRRLNNELRADFESQVRTLRDEIAALRLSIPAEPGHARISPPPVDENAAGSSHIPSTSIAPVTPSEGFPTRTSLGKRPWTGDPIREGGASGSGTQVTATQVLNPARKRPRLAERELSSERVSRPMHVDEPEVGEDEEMVPVAQPVQRGAGFTVFSGPEEPPESSSNVPPSEMFPTSTPPNGMTPSLPTSSAHGAENQLPHTGNNAFTFNYANSIFQPVTSTPLANLSVPAPEPPISPTPAYVERAGGRRERNDPFYPTGKPPSRANRPASRNAEASSSTSTDALRTGEAPASPAALLRAPTLPSVAEEPPSQTPGQTATGTAGAPTPDALAHRAGGLMMPGLVPLPVAPDTPAPPMRRTMYGTELEMDTRFGDFGVEGVATMGFGWGAAPQY